MSPHTLALATVHCAALQQHQPARGQQRKPPPLPQSHTTRTVHTAHPRHDLVYTHAAQPHAQPRPPSSTPAHLPPRHLPLQAAPHPCIRHITSHHILPSNATSTSPQRQLPAAAQQAPRPPWTMLASFPHHSTQQPPPCCCWLAMLTRQKQQQHARWPLPASHLRHAPGTSGVAQDHGLAVHQLAVVPSLGQQLLVGANLPDATLLHHHDLVRVLDGAQPAARGGQRGRGCQQQEGALLLGRCRLLRITAGWGIAVTDASRMHRGMHLYTLRRVTHVIPCSSTATSPSPTSPPLGTCTQPAPTCVR
jgi:hypothetical protein